jgi:hypothetical protein
LAPTKATESQRVEKQTPEQLTPEQIAKLEEDKYHHIVQVRRQFKDKNKQHLHNLIMKRRLDEAAVKEEVRRHSRAAPGSPFFFPK